MQKETRISSQYYVGAAKSKQLKIIPHGSDPFETVDMH